MYKNNMENHESWWYNSSQIQRPENWGANDINPHLMPKAQEQECWYRREDKTDFSVQAERE